MNMNDTVAANVHMALQKSINTLIGGSLIVTWIPSFLPYGTKCKSAAHNVTLVKVSMYSQQYHANVIAICCVGHTANRMDSNSTVTDIIDPMPLIWLLSAATPEAKEGQFVASIDLLCEVTILKASRSSDCSMSFWSFLQPHKLVVDITKAILLCRQCPERHVDDRVSCRSDLHSPVIVQTVYNNCAFFLLNSKRTFHIHLLTMTFT
jgi:hypothetical protein